MIRDSEIKKEIQNYEDSKKFEKTTGYSKAGAYKTSKSEQCEIRDAKFDNRKNIWNNYKPIIKVASILLIIVAIICVVALYVYPTYIEDHPVESIEVEISSEMDAGKEYSYPVMILPSNASDKGLVIDCNDESVTAKVERGRLYVTVGDFVQDGKNIIISLQSKKYTDSYKEVSFIAKNDLTMKLDSASTSMSIGETKLLNAVFNRQIDANIDWTCDNSNIRFEQKGNGVELYAPYDGWSQKVTNVKVTATIPNTTYSSSITIRVSSDYQLSFKTAPSGDLNLGDSYQFEVNLPKGYDPNNIKWELTGNNVSLIGKIGASNTLTVSTEASPGSRVVVEVYSESFGKISKTYNIDDVIYLKTAEQVKSMMKHPDAKYELMNDLDLGTILPLGDSGSGVYSSFTGELNGNKHTITYAYSSKAHIDNNVGYVGLFAQLKNAKVHDLKINATISLGNSSDRYKSVCAGGLAGSASGSEISNIDCKVTMRTPGKDVDYLAGGLVGRCNVSKVTINSCILSVDISVTGGTAHAGGVFGQNQKSTVEINNTTVTGSVYSKGGLAGGYGSSGGIGGYADGGTTTITGCNSGSCSVSSADGGFGGNHKTSSGVARTGNSADVIIR